MTVHDLEEPPGSRCFVCASGNPAGLGLDFSYDDVSETVLATVRFGELHCGAPTFVHAGLTLAVLNEAMAWAVVATTRRFAITSETDAAFVRPVRVGVQYTVEGRLAEAADAAVRASGVLLDGEGRPCARATATFRIISEAIADRLRARVNDPSRAPGGPSTTRT